MMSFFFGYALIATIGSAFSGIALHVCGGSVFTAVFIANLMLVFCTIAFPCEIMLIA